MLGATDRPISGWTPRFAEKVVDTVRRTAAFGALDLMMNGDPAQAPHRDLLLSILPKQNLPNHAAEIRPCHNE